MLDFIGMVITATAMVLFVATLTIFMDASRAARITLAAVIGVWIGLVPIAVPAIFMALGLIVSFLQAFVFSLLTMIYIGLALEEPH